MKLKTLLQAARELPAFLVYKMNEKKWNKLAEDFRGALREYPSLEKDEKTGRKYIEVIFKEGTAPDLAKLPKRIGIWPVRHEFRKPYPNFGELKDLYNAHAAAIESVQDKLAKDMIGLSMNSDKKTTAPVLTFIFEEKSKPDLSQLPAAIGPFMVKHEFRQIPRLG